MLANVHEITSHWLAHRYENVWLKQNQAGQTVSQILISNRNKLPNHYLNHLFKVSSKLLANLLHVFLTQCLHKGFWQQTPQGFSQQSHKFLLSNLHKGFNQQSPQGPNQQYPQAINHQQQQKMNQQPTPNNATSAPNSAITRDLYLKIKWWSTYLEAYIWQQSQQRKSMTWWTTLR